MKIENNKSKKRKIAVVIFIVTLVLLQGMYLFFPLPEIWPLSQYPMFSKLKVSKAAADLEIKGITLDGTEVSLDDMDYFYPLNRSKLLVPLWDKGLLVQDEINRQFNFNKIFNYLMIQYKLNKSNGVHNGPDIQNLNLYGKVWSWKNIQPSDAKPEYFLLYSTKRKDIDQEGLKIFFSQIRAIMRYEQDINK